MMGIWQSDLAQVKKRVGSDDPHVRNAGMLELCERVRKDASSSAAILPIFSNAVEFPRDGWTTANAIRGIGLLRGPDEARRLRIPFFDHPDIDMACPVIISTSDVGCVPALIAVLGRRREPEVCIAVVQTLGRLRDRSALEPMVNALQSPKVRPEAIEALGNLGDPRAIPYLEAWRGDPTPTWPLDDRGGPMMSVGDLAGYAISKIQFVGRGRQTAFNTARSTSAVSLSRPRSRTLEYVLTFAPLVAAITLIPWAILIAILSLDSLGHLKTSPAQTRDLDLIIMIPAVFGLSVGAFVVAVFRQRHVWQWIVLSVGCVACGLAVLGLGWDFFS